MRSVACFALGRARLRGSRTTAMRQASADALSCRISRAGIVPSGARGFCFAAAVFDHMPGKLDWLHDDLEAVRQGSLDERGTSGVP